MAAASSVETKLAFLLITLLVATAEAAMSCATVAGSLSPCLGYLRQGGAAPPQPCCDGAKSLNDAARTTPDRQAVCRCIKTLVPTVGAKPENINSIPEKCHVDVPYRYSPSLDCSKVN